MTSSRALSSHTKPLKVRAWIKPLKNGTWQYYARVAGQERAMGAAYSAESAHDAVCDYVYGNEAYKHGGEDSWEIEWKTQ